ncbi:MAG: YidC/Oxa1 family membrane protein insertase [Eubacteriales bacterium]|nr:YidC/Oxa1 family membrane protein insertase [Eubacteriales bacterium]NCU25708.1 YidC/Oxa1 family membrane protein insertase [Candidatus Nomurabacteria bacterium]
MDFQPIMISMGLLDPLYWVFGHVMRFLYDVFNNFGIVIIIFTILLRAVMIPLGVKQYKGTIKQQGMNKELEDIKRRYGNNKEELQKAQQELYTKHGFSPLAGCLPSIVQLIIIWPVYRMISAPLVRIMGVPLDAIGKLSNDGTATGLTKIVYDLGLMTEQAAKNAEMMNIPIVNALNNSVEVMSKALNEGLIKVGQLIDLNFLGLNLGLNPTYKPAVLFGDEMGTYLPLLIIPILSVVTTWFSMKVSQWTAPNRKQLKEEKERSKKNPAKSAQEAPDPSAGMTKGMTWFMPLFTLWITFTMPAAMGMYWVVGNLMSMAQQFILYFLISKRAEIKVIEPANK